jgi:hypothetical protein
MGGLLLMLLVFCIGYVLLYKIIGATRSIGIVYWPLMATLFIGTFVFFCMWFLMLIMAI